MAVDKLAATVRTILGKLPTTALKQAADSLDDARQALARVGSEQPEMRNAHDRPDHRYAGSGSRPASHRAGR